MSAFEVIEGIVTALAVNECCELSPWAAGKIVRWSAHLRYPDKERAEIRSEELAALIDDRPGKLFKLITALCFAGAAVQAWLVRRCTQCLENMTVRVEPAAVGALQVTTAALLSLTLLAAVTVQAVDLASRTEAGGLSIGAPYQPVNIVVLADESGSVTPVDLTKEIQAVNTITETVSQQSLVTVVGFAGADGFVPNQTPTSVVCIPTIVSGSAARAYLSACTKDLHIRTVAQGNHTDYASAFAEADSYITSEASAALRQHGMAKVILLLTDGGLDVIGNPAYGPSWGTAAVKELELQLRVAQAAGTQLWTCWGVSAGAVMRAVNPGRPDDCPASYLKRLLRSA